MASSLIFCHSCNEWKRAENGRINQAAREGKPIYCGKACSGVARRKENPKTPNNPAWKEIKSAYDREYRAKNKDAIRAKKAAIYACYGPTHRDKEREVRQARMPKHVEYCRRPEYQIKKAAYDRVSRATKQFGEFAEAFLVLQDVEAEINSRMDWYERAKAKGTVNKTNQRKRDYERITGQTQRN